MSVQERFRRYKTTGAGAGLVRVEVLVPAEDRADILAKTAELHMRWRSAQQPVDLQLRTVNRETVNDRAKLILHRLIARALRRDPALLEDAKERFAAICGPVPDYVRDWQAILDQPADCVARAITERTPRMTRLRSASPFRGPPGVDGPDFRRRIWQKAKLGVKP